MGGLKGSRANSKAVQAEGRDHLHLVHGKLLPDAVPAVSSKKRHQAMGVQSGEIQCSQWPAKINNYFWINNWLLD